jgi:protoporphyrinogen IX oxidase
MASSMELWIKALHIIAVIAWMAGMLYLPRLFVYHANAPIGSVQSETFKTMERRLLRAIMMPAMIVVWLTGLSLAWRSDFFAAPWLHAKLALVLAMSAFHGYLVGLARKFAADQNTKRARFYRFINEIPTLLMALIVILVVVKPFS